MTTNAKKTIHFGTTDRLYDTTNSKKTPQPDEIDQQFTILFQNIQSICNKQHIIEAFINQTQEYEAICMTETWLSQEKLNLINFTGYKVAASYCRKTRGGGGICILLKENIDCIEKHDITRMSIEYILEMCAIELVNENILLITIYWNRREEDVFYNQLNKMLTHINLKYSKYNIIIGGDFNIDMQQNSKKAKNLSDLMSEFNFTQQIKQPTRITQNSSTCIDLIFTNSKNTCPQTSVEELGFSDHCSTIISLKISHPQNPQNQNKVYHVKKRIYTKNKTCLFKSALQLINWRDRKSVV